MPRTKSLSRLTALLLCFGLLAGCSQQPQPSNSGESSESPSAGQSSAPPSAATGDSLEVLREIPYYGDPDQCAMTAEQALAYARLLADGLAGTGGMGGTVSDRPRQRHPRRLCRRRPAVPLRPQQRTPGLLL